MLVKWKNMMEKHTSRKTKEIQIDNIEKYKDQFLWFGQNTGIGIHFTNEIHRADKEINRFLLEKVRSLLSNASLDKPFWAEVIVYASHLINRLLSITIGGKTPLYIWSGRAAQVRFVVDIWKFSLLYRQRWQSKFTSKEVCVFECQEKYGRLWAIGPRK